MERFISFGQIHVHSVSGITFDKDCLARVTGEDLDEIYRKVHEAFGTVYAFMYTKEKIKDSIHYFPRGIINLK